MLQSALPPHIIVIIFIRLEIATFYFVTILTRVTTHVNVFYIGKTWKCLVASKFIPVWILRNEWCEAKR